MKKVLGLLNIIITNGKEFKYVNSDNRQGVYVLSRVRYFNKKSSILKGCDRIN